VTGGAVALGAAAAACDAVLLLWPAGQMGGAALADILFGDHSPAGRLPVTFYAATTDLPPMGVFDEYPNATAGHNGTTYRHYVGAPPAYRFGDGLSYTSFAYSSLKVAPTAGACDPITLNVTISNTGTRTSDEVVQVYVATPRSTVPSPRIRLAAFTRVRDVSPGQHVEVTLTLAPDAHAVVVPAASVYTESLAVQAGPLLLYVGGSQPGPATLQANVTVTSTAMLQKCAA